MSLEERRTTVNTVYPEVTARLNISFCTRLQNSLCLLSHRSFEITSSTKKFPLIH